VIQVERVDFVAIPVSDLGHADGFYGGTLGLPRNPKTSGERWVEFETPNVTLAVSTFGGTIALRVPDVHEARRTLEEAGVEFGMDTFDSGVCHGAPFTDPDGNRLLLHRRYAPPSGWEAPASGVERVDFAMLVTQDKERSRAFYEETLGLRRQPNAHEDWPEVETDNLTLSIVGYEQIGRDRFEPNTGAVALRVPDVASVRNRLEDEGVEFRGETMDSGVCHLAVFTDPDGNRLFAHRRYAPFPDGTMP
jgi:catechol 2,3-dioxygenase-like lactoylglutathione lyase family enzyme/predicted lactoylglutathione lyase